MLDAKEVAEIPAIVDEEQKREALAKTQRYLIASAERKVVTMGKG